MTRIQRINSDKITEIRLIRVYPAKICRYVKQLVNY